MCPHPRPTLRPIIPIKVLRIFAIKTRPFGHREFIGSHHRRHRYSDDGKHVAGKRRLDLLRDSDTEHDSCACSSRRFFHNVHIRPVDARARALPGGILKLVWRGALGLIDDDLLGRLGDLVGGHELRLEAIRLGVVRQAVGACFVVWDARG